MTDHRVPAAARVLRALVPTTAHRISQAIKAATPYYRGAPHEMFRLGFAVGVPRALNDFLDELESGEVGFDADMYMRFGRGQYQCGRSLDELLSAYRLGARVAWADFASVLAGLRFSVADTAAVADLGLDFVDRISRTSARSFEHAAATADRAYPDTGLPSDPALQARLRCVLASLASRWALDVLVALLHEPRNFNRLRREVEGISGRMLTHTLRALEQERLIARRALTVDGRRRTLYVLTSRGTLLVGALRPLGFWAVRSGDDEG